MNKRFIVILLRTGISLGCLAACSALALRAYPPLGLTITWLASPQQCSGIREALRSGEYMMAYNEANDRILGSAKMLRQEGKLQLWDVPGARPFWIYETFNSRNAMAFAEQVADQYRHPSVHIQPGDI